MEVKRLLVLFGSLFFATAVGCGTARGIVDGVQAAGAGVLQDARAAIDGVADRDDRSDESE